jgi:hypothetical protein
MKNLGTPRNYRAQAGRPDPDNVCGDNGGADDAGVAPVKRTQFPAAQAGFRFLRS